MYEYLMLIKSFFKSNLCQGKGWRESTRTSSGRSLLSAWAVLIRSPLKGPLLLLLLLLLLGSLLLVLLVLLLVLVVLVLLLVLLLLLVALLLLLKGGW